MSGNTKTLWLWDTLPKKGLTAEEQTWLKEGDNVENVHRLNLGKNRNPSYQESTLEMFYQPLSYPNVYMSKHCNFS